MLVAERKDGASIGTRLFRTAAEYVHHAAGVANRVSQRMRMRDLLGASHCLRRDLQRLIEISQVPQRPAQVAQRSRADVLSILMAQSPMFFWVIERPRLLEVLTAEGELAHRDISCAERAMRQAESADVAVALGLSEEFRRRVSLQDHLASDVMACPNSVQN